MSFTRFNLIMDNALPDKPKRVFFRIPAKLLAQILVDGYFYKEVQLDEISTTGLSFYLRESEDIPENFEVSFRLSPFSGPVKIKVEVKKEKLRKLDIKDSFGSNLKLRKDTGWKEKQGIFSGLKQDLEG